MNVFSGQQMIAANQGWQNDPSANELAAAGYAPLDSRESALKTSLEPGAYKGDSVQCGQLSRSRVGRSFRSQNAWRPLAVAELCLVRPYRTWPSHRLALREQLAARPDKPCPVW